MNNEILIVPDIHGRTFWKDPCNDWKGQIIFLGDYHDPYISQCSQEESMLNLFNLVRFCELHRENVITLIGNHDLSYIGKGSKCRYDYRNEKQIKDLILRLHPKILHTIIQGDNKYLFSHAGVTSQWLAINKYIDEEFAEITQETISKVNSLSLDSESLNQVSWFRGGYDDYSSPLWCDFNEYEQNNTKNEWHQIFGHTQENSPIIRSNYAMLDCRRCFILNTETKEIKEYVKANWQ